MVWFENAAHKHWLLLLEDAVCMCGKFCLHVCATDAWSDMCYFIQYLRYDGMPPSHERNSELNDWYRDVVHKYLIII